MFVSNDDLFFSVISSLLILILVLFFFQALETSERLSFSKPQLNSLIT